MDAYSLIEPEANQENVFVEEYKVPRPLEYNCLDGVPIPPQEMACLFFPRKEQRKRDFVAGIHSFPVISTRFREVIQASGETHVEFHPAELVCTETGERDGGYWVLNILNNVACLDRDRSEYRIFPGTKDMVTDVERLAIRPEALAGREIARIQEVDTLILVSGKLRRSTEAAGLSGIEFTPPEDYSPL